MTPPVRFEIDTTKMREALALAAQWPIKNAPLLLARTAFYVVKETINQTPFSTPEQIDVDMQTAVMLRRKVKGRGFRTAVRTKRYAGGQSKQGPIGPGGWSVPLAAAIIQANVMFPQYSHRSTGYGYRATGQGTPGAVPQRSVRYGRISSPFANKTRQKGREDMRAAVHRMIAARRKSTKFLVQGWYEVKRALYRLVGKAKEGALDMEAGAEFGESTSKDKGFGRVDSGVSGHLIWLEIANIIGTVAGKNGANMAKYNEALMKYGGPALQAGFDREAESKLIHYTEKAMREGLVAEWNAV